jgi:hypothetical protein
MHHRFVVIPAVAAALFCASGHAQNQHPDERPRDSHLRLHWSKSSETDLATVVVGDYDPSPESNYLIGATWGRDYSDTLFGMPFPMSAHVGVQYFDERGYQSDGVGVTAFIKASYDMRVPFTQKYVRLGLGEGLSYVNRIPMSEQRDFAKKGEGVESARLMNYLEWTIDLPLKQFESMKPLMRGPIEDVSVGFIVWHRSSVFGIFSDTKGGVNFMGFGVEARF